MNGYAGSRDYVGTPHQSTHPTKKQNSTLSQELCAGCELFEVISNPHRTLARGSEFVFLWDMWICVGSSVETAESLRNLETRRTPSYGLWLRGKFSKQYVIRGFNAVHLDNYK